MTQIYTQPFGSPLSDHHHPSLYEPRQDSFAPREYHISYQNSSQNFAQDSSHYSSRQYQGNAWRTSPQPLSPMSDHKRASYEVWPLKDRDVYQGRPESDQKQVSREQLPPLSSLFGEPPHQNRAPPVLSPYSDRQSPGFPVVSPNDSRPPATPIHPDRSHDAWSFQRPAISRGYSHESRVEQSARHGIPPHPRMRPESPRYESRQVPIEPPRTQAPSSAHSWSPRSVSSRTEHFSGDTSTSFPPHAEHPQGSVHRQEPETRRQYRSASVLPNLPPTPASTVNGDVATGKDGLGPKIWTGTQFLPRFVRQAEVSGEGMCYFYDDGTHCKTVIDGEVVNAHWGVTKAGKPRKRLAIACITCREKKIKCDPDYPRCVQCEKFGRICKFKNAPRGGQGSPDTPPADPEDILPCTGSSQTDGESSFRLEKRDSSQSVSPRQRQMVRPGTPDSESHHSKRQRVGYNSFTPVASEASPRPSLHEATSPSNPWTEPLISGPIDHSLLREWQTNPYISHPVLVTQLITLFFRNVPETANCMFPEEPFKAWVLSNGEKSVDDLMLIYTILALASIFSVKPEHKALGVQYASISRYACDNRHFSIQLVQSRLILALYYFAINSPNDAWDFCGSALRAASGLKLNLEVEKTDDAYLQTFPYGLSCHGYAESRRRTLWSCYIMDRFNGFSSGHTSFIHPEDVFLRLPCDFKLFQSQADVQTPFFDATNPPLHSSKWSIGSLSYLINISTIYGDVMANIYRNSQRPVPATSNHAFTAFYETMNQRLHQWIDSLPPSYHFSPENLRLAAETGKLCTFMTMHTVYHTTVLKLNRHVQKSTLNSAQLAHHVAVAKQHATSLLAIMDALATSRSCLPSNPHKFQSPFAGYSIISAIDVLTANTSISSIPSLLATFKGAQSILANLALFWQSGKNQEALVLERIRELAELVKPRTEEQGRSSLAGFKFGSMGREMRNCEMAEAIEKTFPRSYDCFYG